MATGPNRFDRKEYRFVFESGVERLAKRLGPFSSFRRFFGAIAIICYLAGFAVEAYALYVSAGHQLLEYLIWTTPGLASNILVVVFLPYTGDATLKMVKAVSPYTTGIDMSSRVLEFFRSRKQILFAIPFAFGAALFQIKFLVISPWGDWLIWYAVSPHVTLARALITSFCTAFGYFLISMLFYVCASSGYLVYRIGKSLRQDLSGPEAESSNLQWLGRLGLVIATAWMASVGVVLLQALVAPIVWWSILQVSLFAASSIALFLLPVTSSYESLNKIKSRALTDIRAKIWGKYQRAVESPSKDEATLVLAQIQALRVFESRIAKLHTCPITSRMLARFVFTFAASNLPLVRVTVEILSGLRLS